MYADKQRQRKGGSATYHEQQERTTPAGAHPRRELPVPGDRRVLAEAESLLANGFEVGIICPATGDSPPRDIINGVLVERFRARRSPFDSGGATAQVLEYIEALVKTLRLMIRLVRSPDSTSSRPATPDLFFLIVWPFKLAGKRFIFDQHDLSPELYSSLYGRDSGLIMSALRWSERLSYRLADAVIASNESYRRIALTRGNVAADRVFVVRNGPARTGRCPSRPTRR